MSGALPPDTGPTIPAEKPAIQKAEIKPAAGTPPTGSNTHGMIAAQTERKWYEKVWGGAVKQTGTRMDEDTAKEADPENKPRGIWEMIGYSLGQQADDINENGGSINSSSRSMQGPRPSKPPSRPKPSSGAAEGPATPPVKVGAKPPVSSPPRKPEEPAKPSNDGGGKNGGISKSKKRAPKQRCELMPYKDMICDGEKHHVLPDYMMRTGSAVNKRVAATRIPGAPEYDNAPAICLSKKEHSGLHKTQDEKISAAGNGGVLSMGKAKEISASEAAKKSGCNPKNIRKQLDRKVKAPDDTSLRSVKDARKVTEEMKDKFGTRGND